MTRAISAHAAAIGAAAALAAMLPGPAANAQDMYAAGQWNWSAMGQRACVSRATMALNAAARAFSLPMSASTFDNWLVSGNAAGVNMSIACVGDDPQTNSVAANTQRVLVVIDVDATRADLSAQARDFLRECFYNNQCGSAASGGGNGGDNGGDGGRGQPHGETIAWNATARTFDLRGRNNERFSFFCPANPDGSQSTIWGTDIYTDDSPICWSAAHSGLITRTGGNVTIEIRPGQSAYAGSTRHDVRSRDYGSWSGSYVFASGGGGGGRSVLPPDNPFVQLGPPSGGGGPDLQHAASMADWTVDHGPFDASAAEIQAQPAGDGATSYYVAPARFYGDWRNAETLVFDKQSSGGSYYGPDSYGAYGDVVIRSGGMTARYDIPEAHTGVWGTYFVPLNDAPWTGTRWQLSGGAQSIDDVLANVTGFLIRAEYGAGTDYSGLRGVKLE